MGFFSGLKASAPTFNPQRAVMTVVVGAIKADGEVSDEEITRLRSMCARSPIFAANSKEEDDALIGFADNVTSQLKSEAIAKAAAALTPPLRETAFAFACEMVLADGMVGDSEERYISMLGQTLGISEQLGNAIVQTTVVRLRGVE